MADLRLRGCGDLGRGRLSGWGRHQPAPMDAQSTSMMIENFIVN